MSVKNRISNVAPVTVITFAAFFVVGMAILATMLALQGPWLGAEFDRNFDGEGIRVSAVLPDSPSAGKLNIGDVIQAFVTAEHGRVELPSVAMLEDPDQLDTYGKYNAFFALQQQIWDALSSPSLKALLADGRSVEITPAKSHPLHSLSASFWWLIFFGGASLILGMSAWSMRRSEYVTRVLAISGIGFMIGAYSCTVYAYRELALPADLFFTLASANHIGIMTFGYAAILVFWHYPLQLGNVPACRIVSLGVVLLWLNETLQILSWPMHAFYAHFLVAYAMLVLFASMQWKRSRGAPLQRTMLKWLLSTVLLSLGFTIVLFYTPTIILGKPISSNVVTFGAVFLFYLGLVIGNIRYHQFDMELWWIRAWQWLVFIFIALIADALFVYFLNMTNQTSMLISIGLGIFYLVIRHWFWGRFTGNSSKALDRALPHLITTLIHQKNSSAPDKEWHQLITRVFNPLSLKPVPEKRESATLEQSGMALLLPNMNGTTSTMALCCDQGKRLFNNDDVHLANRLMELMQHSIDLNKAREHGAQIERNRIQRDLHDDVAARLLSLLHQTREPAVSRFAQNALRGLRDVIHLLGDEDASLSDVMTDIEAGAREQVAGAGVHFEWHSPDVCPEIMLNSQQHINLRRIVREAIANAIRHALPRNIIIEVSCNEQELGLCISNDGAISDPANWKANRGLNNIRSRAIEMGGSHRWSIEHRQGDEPYCQLAVRMPLVIGDDIENDIADRRL